ncbi:MAG: hypothetical protein WA667_04435 [Candidatus Nitrosopolaris sp.]
MLQQKYEQLQLKLGDYEEVIRTHISITTAEQIVHNTKDYLEFEFYVPFETLHQHTIGKSFFHLPYEICYGSL